VIQNSVAWLRLGRRKLRTRMARDRWGKAFLDARLGRRCRNLAARLKESARLSYEYHRPSPTGLKGFGLGGAVVLAVALCIGVKNWGDGAPATPSSASASVAPIERKRIVPPPATAPTQIERTAELASATSPPVVHGELTQLKLSYQSARERCLTRLYTTPEYKSAKAKADQLEATVRSLRGNDPDGELILISPKWIDAKSEVARITQAALKTDPEVQSAENALRAKGLMK
jgi:hypothetical protein